MIPVSDKEIEALAAMMKEHGRIKNLSDRELVFECPGNMENELVIEEMMTRIYPNWSNENPDGSVFEDKA